jgi:hypothetical protein
VAPSKLVPDADLLQLLLLVDSEGVVGSTIYSKKPRTPPQDILIECWGAGGAGGQHSYGDLFLETSFWWSHPFCVAGNHGGAGGYVQVKHRVSASEKFNVMVGQGTHSEWPKLLLILKIEGGTMVPLNASPTDPSIGGGHPNGGHG